MQSQPSQQPHSAECDKQHQQRESTDILWVTFLRFARFRIHTLLIFNNTLFTCADHSGRAV
jgi:hypothetical protein